MNPFRPNDCLDNLTRHARRVALALLIIGALPGTATGGDTETQFWPEVDVYRAFDPNMRVMFDAAPTREVNALGQRSDLSDVDLGVNLDLGLFPIARGRHEPQHYDDHRMRYLRFRAGLHYLDYPDNDAKNEWRIVLALTPRAVLPLDIHADLRNRVDLRWLDEAYSWRYRLRLRVERGFKVGDEFALVPYASAEYFYDSRYDDWNRSLYEIGLAAPVTKWFAPRIYGARQADDKIGGNVYTNAIGLTLEFFF